MGSFEPLTYPVGKGGKLMDGWMDGWHMAYDMEVEMRGRRDYFTSSD